MTLEERASQMWRVHPADLRNLGFETREEFYLAHLAAAAGTAHVEGFTAGGLAMQKEIITSLHLYADEPADSVLVEMVSDVTVTPPDVDYATAQEQIVITAVLQEREANAQIAETWYGLMTLPDPALGPFTNWDLAVEETKTRVAKSIREQKRSLL
jgi:hypothetical protein